MVVRKDPAARRLAVEGCYVMALTLLLCLSAVAKAENVAINTVTTSVELSKLAADTSSPSSEFNGWDYLVVKLRHAGVHDGDIRAIYQDTRMPRFSFVPFRLKPKEGSDIYRGFINEKQFVLGAGFVRQHAPEFDRAERALRVPREVITAIILVESQLGRNTGKSLIIERLSRVASVGEPSNLQKNLENMRLTDPTVTMAELVERAAYLEKTFLPEIPALIQIGQRNQIDILQLRGSIAGAFGMPQFLPSAFLRFGVDGNKDGRISLFDETDAIWSTAKYLAAFGYRDDIPLKEKRSIIWRYNKSDAYIDTILAVSKGIKARLRMTRPSIMKASRHKP